MYKKSSRKSSRLLRHIDTELQKWQIVFEILNRKYVQCFLLFAVGMLMFAGHLVDINKMIGLYLIHTFTGR